MQILLTVFTDTLFDVVVSHFLTEPECAVPVVFWLEYDAQRPEYAVQISQAIKEESHVGSLTLEAKLFLMKLSNQEVYSLIKTTCQLETGNRINTSTSTTGNVSTGTGNRINTRRWTTDSLCTAVICTT